jgi:MFS family permease
MTLHAAIAGMFLALGLGIGLWGGASGAILARAGVDSATFGIILTAYTGVYLIAMSSGGAITRRFGVRATLSVSAVLLGAAFCALLNAPTASMVAALLVLVGFLAGVVDVTMNAEGAGIERAAGKPLLARLHAAASFGMAIGAILGSLIVAGAAPWGAGLIAAAALAAAGFAYDRAARGEIRKPLPAPVTRHGLSFAPALIGLGIVIGLSIAAETADALLFVKRQFGWR